MCGIFWVNIGLVKMPFVLVIKGVHVWGGVASRKETEATSTPPSLTSVAKESV